MFDRKPEPIMDCDVFHVSGDFTSDGIICISGNFIATGGVINVEGIDAGGDIILDAVCPAGANFITADFLHAGGQIIIRNFENSIFEVDAEEGADFSYDGPCYLCPDVGFGFEDTSDDDGSCDGEYSIQDEDGD